MLFTAIWYTWRPRLNRVNIICSSLRNLPSQLTFKCDGTTSLNPSKETIPLCFLRIKSNISRFESFSGISVPFLPSHWLAFHDLSVESNSTCPTGSLILVVASDLFSPLCFGLSCFFCPFLLSTEALFPEMFHYWQTISSRYICFINLNIAQYRALPGIIICTYLAYSLASIIFKTDLFLMKTIIRLPFIHYQQMHLHR